MIMRKANTNPKLGHFVEEQHCQGTGSNQVSGIVTVVGTQVKI
jgi:hypothetical protein